MLKAEELMLLKCGAGGDLESPLDCKEIQPVNPKRNQLRIFIGKTDAESEAPILWPPDAKSQLIGKDLMPRKTEGRRRRGRQRIRWLGASSTQWTWVWANSGIQWRTGKSGVLQSMGSQRVRPSNGVAEQQQRYLMLACFHKPLLLASFLKDKVIYSLKHNRVEFRG